MRHLLGLAIEDFTNWPSPHPGAQPCCSLKVRCENLFFTKHPMRRVRHYPNAPFTSRTAPSGNALIAKVSFSSRYQLLLPGELCTTHVYFPFMVSDPVLESPGLLGLPPKPSSC